MYDRAPRNFTFQSSTGTAEPIGPGTYQHYTTITSKAEGYAPFLSLAGRDFAFASDDLTTLPAPSQYDPKLVRSRVQGGTSISNKEDRFKSIKSDVPGPGNYNPCDQIKCHSSGSKTIMDRKSEKSKVKLIRADMAPSIPHAKTAYGYEEGPFGTLIKQKPPQRDISLGPAFYRPKIDDTATTVRYRGCFWSRDRGNRGEMAVGVGPSPAEYDTREQLGHLKNPLADAQTLPRFMDILVSQAVKEQLPGPGTYNEVAVPIQCPKKSNDDEGPVEHPPFNHQAERFTSSYNPIPGPGTYNDPRSALDSLKKVSGMKRSPFGTTSIRFNDRLDTTIPGPQAYDVSSTSDVHPSYISFTKKGGFGSTSIRSTRFGDRNFKDTPGPAHYQPKEMEISKVPQPLSSMFASLTNRDFDPVVAGKSALPDSCSYNVIQSFEKSQGRKDPAPPRTHDAKKRHGTFMSYADRYARGSPLVCSEPLFPGPTTYDIKNSEPIRGKFYSKQKRFNAVTEVTPGPPHYEISEEVLSSVKKQTFNATLSGPLKDAVAAVTDAIPPTRENAIAVH